MAGARGVDTACHWLTRRGTSCHALSGLGGFFLEGLRNQIVRGDILVLEIVGKMSDIWCTVM